MTVGSSDTELCIHEFDPASCGLCRPRQPRSQVTAGPFVWIAPARFYHLPDCPEVLWDPSEAAHPGERHNLTRPQVFALLEQETLERGCKKCGANAGVAPTSDVTTRWPGERER